MRILALLLVALLLAGCSGGGAGEQGVPGDDGAPKGHSGEVGAVSGLVMDDERQPIAGAEVRLVELSRNTTSNAEGRFVFSKVPVGSYVLNATANGFHGGDVKVTVEATRTSSLLVTLLPLPRDVAFHVTFPYEGMQDCMVYTSVFLMSCSYPYTAGVGTAAQHGVNLTQYGVPADVQTNRYKYNFSVGADHTAIISELVWKAATDSSRYYKLQLSCAWYDAVVDDCLPPGQTAPSADTTYAVARGISPLRIEWKQDMKPKWLPWIMARAYLSGPVDKPAGAALSQRISMYNTVFYGAKDRKSVV